MVRNIIGTIVEAGKLRRSSIQPDDIPRILESKNKHSNPSLTAPPQGLFLVDVHYDDNPFIDPITQNTLSPIANESTKAHPSEIIS